MPAWEREHGELPSPTFVPVGREAGGHVCLYAIRSAELFSKAKSRLRTQRVKALRLTGSKRVGEAVEAAPQ